MGDNSGTITPFARKFQIFIHIFIPPYGISTAQQLSLFLSLPLPLHPPPFATESQHLRAA